MNNRSSSFDRQRNPRRCEQNNPVVQQAKACHVVADVSTRRLRTSMLALAMFAALPMSNAAAASNELFGASQQAGPAASAAQTKRIEHLKKQKTTASLRLVKIDIAALSGASVQIPSSSAGLLTYVKTRTETNGPHGFTWYGNLAGGPGNAILVVHDGVVTGSVTENGNLSKIESVGEGSHAFIEINNAGFPEDHPTVLASDRHFKSTTTASTTGTTATTGTTPTTATTATTPTTATTTSTVTAVAPTTIDNKTIIDVMVAYPSTVASAVADIAGLVTLAVAETNQAYINSGVRIQMNLVGAVPIAYSEAGKDYQTMLSDVTASPEVKLKRDSLGADVVITLTTNPAYCGMAYLMPGADMAFGVVNYSCATGYYSFGHEIGHIHGLQHDPVTSPGTYPVAYGHGYQSTNSSPSWRTIMAYNCSPSCTRLPYFSSPNQTYNGLAMGTPTVSDNARLLNETATGVSLFRSSPAP